MATGGWFAPRPKPCVNPLVLGGSHAFRLDKPGSGPRSGPAQPVHLREVLLRLAFLKDTTIPKPATITISSHSPMNHPTLTPPADGNVTARVVGDVDDVAQIHTPARKPGRLADGGALAPTEGQGIRGRAKAIRRPRRLFPTKSKHPRIRTIVRCPVVSLHHQSVQGGPRDSPLHRQPLHSRSSSTVLMGRRKHSPIRRVHDGYRSRHRGTLRLRGGEPGTHARRNRLQTFQKI